MKIFQSKFLSIINIIVLVIFLVVIYFKDQKGMANIAVAIFFIAIILLHLKRIFTPYILIKDDLIIVNKKILGRIKGWKNRWKYHFIDNETISLYNIDENYEFSISKLTLSGKQWGKFVSYLEENVVHDK